MEQSTTTDPMLYSPLFTSGFESAVFHRRGSLPTDTPLHAASQKIQSPTDETAVFYFTMKDQYRSFLSLDLAESVRSSHLSQPRRRPSRDSLRSLPSPKPAPSSSLPSLPVLISTQPTVPPAHASFAPSSIPSISVKTPSLRSLSISSTYRNTRRQDALARLEGRSTRRRHARTRTRRNFMSMSDDEDDIEDDFGLGGRRNGPIDEDEDIVLPPSPIEPPLRSAPLVAASAQVSAVPKARKRRSTAESWFPLASFIDLREDEGPSSWNWRSFIELSSLS